MAESTKKLFLISIMITLSRAENETVSERSASQNVFSNFTIYLSFLDDTYNYLASSPNVSEKCRLESLELLTKSRTGDLNALKFLDSVGKPSSGILEGGVFFIGFYEECVNSIITTNRTSKQIEGQYCLINLNFHGSVPKNIPEASFLIFEKSQKPPNIGVCIPSSCSEKDLNVSVLLSFENNFENINGSVSACHGNQSGISTDIGALCIMSILVIFTSICIVATVADVIQENNKCTTGIKSSDTDNAKSISREVLCEIVESKTPRKSMECLLAFSLKRNIKKIFVVEAKRETIQGVHGLKFLSMTLIILGHSYSFSTANMFFRNPGAALKAPKDFLSQIFSNGTLAVDTFYVISSLLVSNLTLKVLDKKEGKFPLLYFYLHRYCRLTPLLMMVTLTSAYLLRYIGSGPNWLPSIVMYDEWCRKNAWINALYLQNFIHTDQMCMSHTWYLATDMQFYLVVPLIVVPLFKYPKCGIFIAISFLFASCMTTGIITKVNHYPAIPYMNTVLPQTLINGYYKNVYIKPYCRFGPYVIGILLGYFFWKKKDITLNKYFVTLGWLLSVTMSLLVIYLMWPANKGFLPSDNEAAAYSALARPVWAVTLAWLLFACNYGYSGFINSILSWPPLIPLSRLTYCAYLIHPIVMNAFYGTMQSVLDFSLPFMIYMFLGNFVITFCLSIFLSAMFESPFIALEKVLLSRS